jgi:hypothetical protein
MSLHRGRKKKRLRQDRLEHNITQFSRGCRVLCSGGSNHINHRVHRVHLELTTKRLKTFLTKESQRAAAVAAPVEVSQNHFDIWRVRKGAWCFSRSGASTTPSCRPHDDGAASQPEARGGCYSAIASPSPRSHAGSLPQMSSCSNSCSTVTE